MSNSGNARIAITMGDPAGAGPAAFAALLNAGLDTSDLIYIGSRKALRDHGADDALMANLTVHDIALPAALEVGRLSHENGPAVIEALEIATQKALSGEVDAIVTGPIHKAALYSNGFQFPGHTEYLAEKAGLASDDVVMMLSSPDLRVVPLTIHIPLHAVPKALTTDLIIRKALITYHGLRVNYGIENPRLVVAGLNPHAGEDGTIGHEEATHIQPAIWALEDKGIKVVGPLSADTMFHAEARSEYDAALCCYHDQALIPIKTIDIWGGVNVTLGLPFIRTSPDHGTAFDAVLNNELKPDSLHASIRAAREMLIQKAVSP